MRPTERSCGYNIVSDDVKFQYKRKTCDNINYAGNKLKNSNHFIPNSTL